jgi:hypothetical protein
MILTSATPTTRHSSTPLVSVAVPVYQGSGFLAGSLGSVLRQRFRDFELLVVDDCSADDSYTVAQRICATASDVTCRVVRNTTRAGLFGNWNRCLAESRGTYILLFHQDDLLDPGMLERAVAAFTHHPDAGLWHCAYRCIDNVGRDSPPWSTSPFPDRAGGEEFLRRLIAENFICCPSVVIPRRVYEDVGVYDTRFAFSADLEMWVRIASRYDVLFEPEMGLQYRVHAAQATEEFRSTRTARADLEHIVAAVVGLDAQRARYRRLWRALLRDSLWTVRQHARSAPAETAWALRMLARRPLDVALTLGEAVSDKISRGLRRSGAAM